MAVIKVHRANPGAEIDALIRVANQAATLANAVKTDLATFKTKINADAGVTDADYAFTTVEAASACDTILESY